MERDRYQRLEFLFADDEVPNDCKNGVIDGSPGIDDSNGDIEICSPPSNSSSPPRDFDIDSQYIRLYDGSPDENYDQQRSSSLASSLTIESSHDYESSPVTLATTSTPVASSRSVIKCPVCQSLMRNYYCAKCLIKGRFVTYDPTKTDKFTETNLRIQDKEPAIEAAEKALVINEELANEEKLRYRFRTLARKTEALRNLYKSQQEKLEETKNLLKETKRLVELEKKSNKSKEGKIELIKRYISSRKASIKKRQKAENELVDDLKQYVSRRVFQLTTDIFPIEEVNLLEQSGSMINMETSPLLTFSDGSHHQIEQLTAFSIVEPWLPSDGDYSSYSLWLNENQDHIPASVGDLSERNPAFRIGAALAYTTQLVRNLASYLDVILPAKLDLETFNRELLSHPQFAYNVAKLNANVIHLCVSQGVDVSLLHPQKTLKNLMLLFNLNLSNLGRKPIMELDNEEANCKIEERLNADLSLIQDSFYDFSKFNDDDDEDDEWEISDGNINPMEMQMAVEQQQHQVNSTSYISRLPMRLFSSFWSTGS